MTSSRLKVVASSFKVPRTPMRMFADEKESFNSNRHSTNFPSSACHSLNLSFSSDSSCESALLATPISTRRQSFDSVKLEDVSFLNATPSGTPERFGSGMGYCPLSSLTEDILSGFQDTTMLLSGDGGKNLHGQNLVPFYTFSTGPDSIYEQFNSHHGLPTDVPVLDLSPTSGMGSSPVSMDFVVPSQTTFRDSFDMHSPVLSVKPLQFDMEFESPASDYMADFSLGNPPAGSTKYFSSGYTDSKSTSTTPSRPSTLRQLVFEPLDTSAALQRVQHGVKVEEIKKDQAARHLRRRVKKEGIKRESGRFLPPNIRIQKLAKKECPWEGCNGKFQRQEHLKRHEKTHLNIEVFPCIFCGKRFGRSDNLKSHIKLHADPLKKSRRTEYYPDAQRELDEMTRKQKKSAEQASSPLPPRVRVSEY